MDVDETNKQNETTVGGWVGLAALVILGLFALWGLVTWLSPDSKLEAAVKSYNRAVETCGADNIQTHEYTDGSKDFDCRDYSLVEK